MQTGGRGIPNFANFISGSSHMRRRRSQFPRTAAQVKCCSSSLLATLHQSEFDGGGRIQIKLIHRRSRPRKHALLGMPLLRWRAQIDTLAAAAAAAAATALPQGQRALLGLDRYSARLPHGIDTTPLDLPKWTSRLAGNGLPHSGHQCRVSDGHCTHSRPQKVLLCATAAFPSFFLSLV